MMIDLIIETEELEVQEETEILIEKGIWNHIWCTKEEVEETEEKWIDSQWVEMTSILDHIKKLVEEVHL